MRRLSSWGVNYDRGSECEYVLDWRERVGKSSGRAEVVLDGTRAPEVSGRRNQVGSRSHKPSSRSNTALERPLGVHPANRARCQHWMRYKSHQDGRVARPGTEYSLSRLLSWVHYTLLRCYVVTLLRWCIWRRRKTRKADYVWAGCTGCTGCTGTGLGQHKIHATAQLGDYEAANFSSFVATPAWWAVRRRHKGSLEGFRAHSKGDEWLPVVSRLERCCNT